MAVRLRVLDGVRTLVGAAVCACPTTIAPADGICMPGGPLLSLLSLRLWLLAAVSLESSSSSCSRVASVLNISLSDESGPDMSVSRSRIRECPRLLLLMSMLM